MENEAVVNRSTASRWFHKFAADDLNLADMPRMRRPPIDINDPLQDAVNATPQSSTRVLARVVGSSKSTVNRRLHDMDYTKKKPR